MFWRKLTAKLRAKSDGATGHRETALIYVLLPVGLEPEERAARFEDGLDAELRLAEVGFVSGGGTLLGPEKPDGTRDIKHSGIDVDAYDLPAALDILRLHLPELGCPLGTQLHYRSDADVPVLDVFERAEWRLGLPRAMTDPRFGG